MLLVHIFDASYALVLIQFYSEGNIDVTRENFSGFRRIGVNMNRMKNSDAEYFIVIGDAEGKILLYEQVRHPKDSYIILAASRK